jgi:hypothetical protein
MEKHVIYLGVVIDEWEGVHALRWFVRCICTNISVRVKWNIWRHFVYKCNAKCSITFPKRAYSRHNINNKEFIQTHSMGALLSMYLLVMVIYSQAFP